MTRRFRRSADFDVALQIHNDAFIRPPREAQRDWLLNRALTELVQDLTHLDAASRTFVPGGADAHLSDRTQAVLSDDEIMEDWQIPVMEAMARVITEAHGDVLEIGFGRGVASTIIQANVVRSHTIIECNDSVVERYHAWREGYPERDIRLIHSKWQDATEQLGRYDGIFFHTYPLDENEFVNYVTKSVTFAAHFFPTAASHLREGGAFSYLTNEVDSLSRAHQRLLLEHFRSFSVELVGALNVPADSQDQLWGDSMVVVKAEK